MEFASNELNNEELYALALKYRDKKVEGFTADESIAQCEKLFLQLANSGNSAAMHNYAAIQFKKENFDEAYKYFSLSDLPASKRNCAKLLQDHLVQQDVYLIVGSRRKLESEIAQCVDEVHGSNVNLTHVSTFNGKAITMDILPSEVVDANHIVADASTYDFVKNKLNIKHAFLERLPTANFSSNHTDRLDNITGKCVVQIAKAMQSEAILEIEWEPYTSVDMFTASETDQNLLSNPFHAFLNCNNLAHAIDCLYHTDRDRSKDSQEIQDLAILQSNELEYFVKHGMQGTMEELITRVYHELLLYIETCRQPGVPMWFPDVQHFATMSDFNDCLAQAFIEPSLSKYPIGSKLTVQHPKRTNNKKVAGLIINASQYIIDGLLNYLNNSVAVHVNTPYVVKYLQSVGFKDVIVERRTNIHNGRNNVWMVTAVKI